MRRLPVFPEAPFFVSDSVFVNPACRGVRLPAEALWRFGQDRSPSAFAGKHNSMSARRSVRPRQWVFVVVSQVESRAR